MYAAGGSGVPRSRLRIPSSRARARLVTVVAKQALSAANAIIAGETTA